MSDKIKEIDIERFICCASCLTEGSKNMNFLGDKILHNEHTNRLTPYKVFSCKNCGESNFLNLNTIALLMRAEQYGQSKE